MPELPEVETLRLQLSQLIVGKTIKSIDILKTKSFLGDKKLVVGKKIIGVRRFAKILVLDLSDKVALAIHLKMSGQLLYRSIKYKVSSIKYDLLGELPNKHTRIIFSFTNGDKLFFNDQRIFGWIRILRNYPINQLSNKPINEKILNINDLIKKLGPEPLKDLTLKKFKEILARSKKPIKLLLMDQEKIAGVGNIYANDALFLAGIHPEKKANEIKDGSIVTLFNCLQKVLKDGIKWKGASKNHFRDVYGRKGQVQEHFHVYDREGQLCLNKCGDKIKRMKLGGRGTFFCPKCQNLV